MNEIEAKLQEIKADLKALRRLGEAVKLKPCLPLARVDAFEARNDVRLPEGFKRFITEIGNSGEGPIFQDWPGFDPEADWLNDPAHWARPFVHPSRLKPEEVHANDVGYINLGDYGCGIFDLLVVTGDEAGNIWWSDDRCRRLPASAPGHRPDVKHKDADADHLAYEAWRAELLALDYPYRQTFLEYIGDGLADEVKALKAKRKRRWRWW